MEKLLWIGAGVVILAIYANIALLLADLKWKVWHSDQKDKWFGLERTKIGKILWPLSWNEKHGIINLFFDVGEKEYKVLMFFFAWLDIIWLLFVNGLLFLLILIVDVMLLTVGNLFIFVFKSFTTPLRKIKKINSIGSLKYLRLPSVLKESVECRFSI